jgi:general stress protein YciG
LKYFWNLVTAARFTQSGGDLSCPIKIKIKGKMTVDEAGRRGGEKTASTYGKEFYSKIGKKGGQRVRKLIQEGKEHEEE